MVELPNPMGPGFKRYNDGYFVAWVRGVLVTCEMGIFKLELWVFL
jgi:hypothetical protein